MTYDSPSRPASPLLEADDLGLREGREWAFRGLTFQVGPGELVQVVEAPSLRRTAAVLVLAARMKSDAGRLLLSGDVVEGPDRRVALGWIPGARLYDDRAHVGEVLRQARGVRGASPSGTLEDDLKLLGLDEHQRAGGLAPLSKALLGMLAAAALGPGVVVADLPSGANADHTRADRLLQHLRDQGTGLVVATERTPSDTRIVVPLQPASADDPAVTHRDTGNGGDRRAGSGDAA